MTLRVLTLVLGLSSSGVLVLAGCSSDETSTPGGTGANAGTAGSGASTVTGGNGGTGAAGASGSGGSSSDFTSCTASSDCVVVSASCCGFCGTPAASAAIAIASSKVSAYDTARHCDAVDCAACETFVPIQIPFGATCRNGHCALVDPSATGHFDCVTASDCSLRAGLNCCEGCVATSSTWFAVSDPTGLTAELCGSGAAMCPACAADPGALGTACSEGKCQVVTLPTP